MKTAAKLSSAHSFLLLSVIIICTEFVIKQRIVQWHGDVVHLVPGWIMLGSYTNSALFLGWIPLAPSLAITIVTIALALVCGFRYRLQKPTIALNLGLAAVAGGGAANLVDRCYRGWVMDYLHIRILPVTNLADWAIFIGLITILLKQPDWTTKKE